MCTHKDIGIIHSLPTQSGQHLPWAEEKDRNVGDRIKLIEKRKEIILQ